MFLLLPTSSHVSSHSYLSPLSPFLHAPTYVPLFSCLLLFSSPCRLIFLFSSPCHAGLSLPCPSHWCLSCPFLGLFPSSPCPPLLWLPLSPIFLLCPFPSSLLFLFSFTSLLLSFSPFTPSSSSMQGREGNYKVHSGSVDQLCWHPTKADILVTASGDKTIRIWDARGTCTYCVLMAVCLWQCAISG